MKQRSKEHCQKISEARKGKKLSEEHKQNISKGVSGNNNPMFGKTFYDIWVIKYGKEIADEKLQRFKENKKGKKHTKEHNQKISEALKGENNPFFGKQLTNEHKAKISQNHHDCKGEKNPMYHQGHKIRGEKNGSWLGGITENPYDINFNEELKTKIRKRDKFTCAICGKHGHSVHHIDYDKLNSNEENLITLCTNDHMKTNFNRESWKSFFATLKINK